MQYKHYIKIDGDNYITAVWSSGFDNSEDGVLLHETNYRKFYFEVNNIKIFNPALTDMDTQEYLYKYINGEVVLDE